MFLKLLKDAVKVRLVRNKILFTIFILFVFRVGTHITVPGINAKSLEALSKCTVFKYVELRFRKRNA